MGDGAGLLPEELEHSRLIVLWGTNTVSTNLHLWPFVREARDAGATVVVVDPLRTRTADAADWHVRPMPGTDAALALGLMHVIVAEGRHDAEWLAAHTVGFEQLRERLAEYPPERVAGLTGLEADEVVRLARAVRHHASRRDPVAGRHGAPRARGGDRSAPCPACLRSSARGATAVAVCAT